MFELDFIFQIYTFELDFIFQIYKFELDFIFQIYTFELDFIFQIYTFELDFIFQIYKFELDLILYEQTAKVLNPSSYIHVLCSRISSAQLVFHYWFWFFGIGSLLKYLFKITLLTYNIR